MTFLLSEMHLFHGRRMVLCCIGRTVILSKVCCCYGRMMSGREGSAVRQIDCFSQVEQCQTEGAVLHCRWTVISQVNKV